MNAIDQIKKIIDQLMRGLITADEATAQIVLITLLDNK